MENHTPSPNPEDSTKPAGEPSAAPPPSNRNFWIALIALLTPGLIALLGSDTAGSLAAFLVAPIASLVAGSSLAIRFGGTPAAKTLWSLALIPLCFIAAEVIAAVGCDLGGFKLRIQ